MKQLLIFLFFFYTAIFANAQQNDNATDTTIVTIKVGVKISPPFIMRDCDGKFDGVSIRLWESIANELNLDYEYIEHDLRNLLFAIEKGDVDISISPLTVTSERLEKFEFTQPFYASHLSIAAPNETKHPMILFITNFFSLGFLKAFVILLGGIIFFGLLIWLVERRKNTEQFSKGIKGIGQGVWWSAVTMTTVGYGDKYPKSFLGRSMAFFWMFLSIVVISSLTGSMAATLTVQQYTTEIEKIEDLKKHRVGTVDSSNSANVLLKHGVNFKTYNNISDVITAFRQNEIGSFVYDDPIMRYAIYEHHFEDSIKILQKKLNTQYYSFALPKKHFLLDTINIVLIKKLESVYWKGIINYYGLEIE